MPRRPAIGALALLLAAAAVPARDATRIYIAPDDHTDYLWTADEETYRQAFLRMIDYYLDLADATEDLRPEHQSRWNCDGSLWLWTYERSKSPEELERLLDRIRDGHVTVPLNALVSTYGAQPTEAILRGMYYPGRIERRHGIRFPIAIAMENQTLPYGLGALWAGSGARYSWKGICGCATRMRRNERRPHEVYWWEGADGSRILMKWYSLLESSEWVGGYAEARDPAAAVDRAGSDPRFRSLHPHPVVGIFGKGWDDLETLGDEFVTVAREKTNDARTVIVSNQLDYFQDLEAHHGEALPAMSAGFGNEWDLYSASLSEVSARVRRSVERLRAAEGLATLVSLARPGFWSAREAARERAWMDLGIFWEHNWTADGPIKREARAAWQRRLAGEIESYVGELHADAAYQLGDLIANGGEQPRFYVYNPLSWTRTDRADLPYAGEGPVHVVDLTTGREVPSQAVRLPDPALHEGQPALRVLASDVPPVGYKVLEVRPGARASFEDAATVSGDVLESDLYRLEVEPRGAIRSWIDKAAGGRELVREVDGRLVNDLGPGGGALSVENAGSVSVTLVARAEGPPARETRITLLRGSRRVELRNEITENFAGVESWAFGFALDSPDTWHEEVGAIIRARLLGGGGHYSATNSRLDWLTLNHFVDISEPGGRGMTLSNADLAFMRLGRSAIVDGVSTLDVHTPQVSVLAGGQVDGPKLGIPVQGGDTRFLQRFALAPHEAFDPAAAMRFALEHQNPLAAGRVRGGDAYPETSFSLLAIDNPDVLLWSVKPAEEGIDEGIVARVWNVSPEQRRFSLSLAPGVEGAMRTSHIETDRAAATVSEGALSDTAARSQLLTYRLRPRPARSR